MGYIQNLRPSFLEGLGQKVRKGAEIFGKAKGLWETGKMIYNGVKTIMPLVNEAASLVPYIL